MGNFVCFRRLVGLLFVNMPQTGNGKGRGLSAKWGLFGVLAGKCREMAWAIYTRGEMGR